VAVALLRGARMELTVGIADVQVSASPEVELVTYGLGSCIAVLAFDPVSRCAGMLHLMLPTSAAAPERARDNPAIFADTGIPLLLRRMQQLRASTRRLVVKLVGGGSLCDESGVFEIGRRNYEAVRRALAEAQVAVLAEDVGGARPRTVRFHVGSGRVQVGSQGNHMHL
jgi:chemotaxis protein CheD